MLSCYVPQENLLPSPAIELKEVDGSHVWIFTLSRHMVTFQIHSPNEVPGHVNYEKSHEKIPSLLSANVCINLSLCTIELLKNSWRKNDKKQINKQTNQNGTA